jgi:hypothetical protein
MTAKQIREEVLHQLKTGPKLIRQLATLMSATAPEIRSALVALKNSGRVKPCFFVGQTNPFWLRTCPLIGSDATPCYFCHKPCGIIQYVLSDPPDEQYATCGDCVRGLGQLSLTHVEGGRPVLSLEMMNSIKEALRPPPLPAR